MPKLKVKFSEAREFEALPDGAYPVVVDATEVRQKDDNSTPYIVWKLKIVSGEHAGRFLWHNTFISEKGAWTTQQALIAFGETDPKIVEGGDIDIDPDDYLGREAIAQVVLTTYNNAPANDIERLVPMPDAVGAGSSSGRPRLT